jgi:hypothetical protein
LQRIHVQHFQLNRLAGAMHFLRIAAGLAVLLIVFAGCDNTPGVREEAAPPAFVPGSFSLQPRQPIEVPVPDSLPANVGIEINLLVGVRVKTSERIDSVKYVVRPPVDLADPETGEVVALASGALQPAGGDRYEADTSIVLPTSLPGLYTVEVYGTSEAGRLVRQKLSGKLRFITNGGPPVVQRLRIPDTVAVPAEEPKRIRVRALVTDPQGRLNVGQVRLHAPGGARYVMRDDGGGDFTGSGDGTAGDSTFTARYPVEPSQEAGTFTFTVRAVDRGGRESDSVSTEVTFTRQ